MHIFAYVDPGVGALIWQSIVGVFVGLFFYLRQTRKWLGQMMKKAIPSKEKQPEASVGLPLEKSKVEADHL
jgi:hypothetical protein